MKNPKKRKNFNHKESRIMIYFLSAIIILIILQTSLIFLLAPTNKTIDMYAKSITTRHDQINTYSEIWNSHNGSMWLKNCHEGPRSVVGVTAIIKFDEPMNRTSVEYATEVRLDNDTWLLNEQDKPFTISWDNNRTTMTLDFPVYYLEQLNPHYINYTVNRTAKTIDGENLTSDYESGVSLGSWVELEGNFEKIEGKLITYPPWYWYLTFFLPFISIIIFFILIEISIKKEVNHEGKTNTLEKVTVPEGIAEILLKLLHNTETWLDQRLNYTFAFSIIAVFLYFALFYFVIPIVWDSNIGFMVTIILIIIPWFIFTIFSFFYYRIRKDNIKWKNKIITLRKHEEQFLSSYNGK